MWMGNWRGNRFLQLYALCPSRQRTASQTHIQQLELAPKLTVVTLLLVHTERTELVVLVATTLFTSVCPSVVSYLSFTLLFASEYCS